MDSASYPREGRSHEARVSRSNSLFSKTLLTAIASFISRASPKNTSDHVILGVLGYKPREFAAQMNLNLNNGWAIVRTFIDMVMRDPATDAKYVMVKDPNKPTIRLYQVPKETFEEDEGDDVGMSMSKVDEDGGEE